MPAQADSAKDARLKNQAKLNNIRGGSNQGAWRG